MADSKVDDNYSSLDITVKTFTGKTITLKVKGSDTIFYVKSKIRDEVDIPVEEQALIFDGELLEEDFITLANFGIIRGSTLKLLHRSRGLVPIFIKYNDGRIDTLKVKLSDTINNVKSNIPPYIASKSVLIFNNTVLDDNSTLCDSDIKKGSTLTVMHKKEVNIEIFVKTPTRETSSLTVGPSCTIAEVKYLVGNPAGVLIFNETVLEDSSSVSDFDIKNGSTLTLLPKSTGHIMQICVSENSTGKSIPLEVKHSDTILYMKAKIYDIVGIPINEQKLVLNGKRVKDSCTLDDYNIQKEDTFDLFRPCLW